AGIKTRVERPQACWAFERRAAQQGQRAVRRDLETRDRGVACVDGEEILAVVGDLDPARRRPQVGERRAVDRGQLAVLRDLEGRDSAVARATMRVRDEQLG